MNGKEEQRIALKFCYKLGYSASKSYQLLNEAYGDDCLSRSQSFEWSKRFSQGSENTKDAKRSGRPSSATTPDQVQAVEAIILENRRTGVREIAQSVNISIGSTYNIISDILGYKKLCARWVPRILTELQRQNRVTMCQQWRGLHRRYGDDFLNSIVTCDESWFHHYDPESKQQSMQWMKGDEQRPQKAKVVKSAGKVMHLVFFDIHGVIYDHVVPKGQGVTGQYYSDVLKGPFMQKMRQKRQELLHRDWWFHQDNAPAHTCRMTMETIDDLGIQILPHPPYSPDLAPADFFLFPETKREIKGRHFGSDEELNNCIMGIFTRISRHGFHEKFQRWTHRWQKCITSDGFYFEGQ